MTQTALVRDRFLYPQTDLRMLLPTAPYGNQSRAFCIETDRTCQSAIGGLTLAWADPTVGVPAPDANNPTTASRATKKELLVFPMNRNVTQSNTCSYALGRILAPRAGTPGPWHRVKVELAPTQTERYRSCLRVSPLPNPTMEVRQ